MVSVYISPLRFLYSSRLSDFLEKFSRCKVGGFGVKDIARDAKTKTTTTKKILYLSENIAAM